MGNITISKNKVIICLLVLITVLVISFVYIYTQHKKADALERESDVSFEMIDPENPLTQRDLILKLKNKDKFLNQEQDRCSRVIKRAGSALADQKRMSMPDFEVKNKILNLDATDFLNYYYSNYRFPTFFEGEAYVYDLQTYDDGDSGEEVASILDKYKTKYYEILNTSIKNAGLGNFYSFRDYQRNMDYNYNDTSVKINKSAVESLPDKVEKLVNELITELTTKIETLKALQAENMKEYDKRLKEYKNTRFDMSGKAISWGIIAFVLTAIVLYVAGLKSREETRKRMKDSNVTPEFYDDLKTSMWYSVYLITVLLLIITIFVLGLARLLTENTLAALLGGIAGYVLNNKQSDSSPPTPQYITVPVKGDIQINEAVHNQQGDAAAEDSNKEENK